ncbi:hypothetical protein CYY_000432 [Polysphondylium violaceum]|uniref:Uncharacterized protein n=1 Tax=Polysphondylium violaceum TaxID=133409 RepID=A0A8J4V8X9_9MYCE|nr:hypothetical protein CYY_000432 [Polysphondylium violaceum]
MQVSVLGSSYYFIDVIQTISEIYYEIEETSKQTICSDEFDDYNLKAYRKAEIDNKMRHFLIKLWNGEYSKFTLYYTHYHVYSTFQPFTSDTIMLVFNLNDRESFHINLINYVQEITRFARTGTPIIIIGISDYPEGDSFREKNRVSMEEITKIFPISIFCEYQSYLPLIEKRKHFKESFDPLIKLIFARCNSIRGRYLIKNTHNKNGIPYKQLFKKDLDLYNIYPHSHPVKFNNQKERDKYEESFFRVFKNKFLFHFIFQQIHIINYVHNQNPFKISPPTSPAQLISCGFSNELKDILIKNQSQQQFRFTYLDIVFLLRSKETDFQLFSNIYDRYFASFHPENGPFYWLCRYGESPSSDFSTMEALNHLENSTIGGNIDIISFFLKKDNKLLTSKCIELAIVNNYLYLVKLYLKEIKTKIDFQELVRIADDSSDLEIKNYLKKKSKSYSNPLNKIKNLFI